MAGADRKETVNVPLADLYKTIVDYEAYPQFVGGMKSVKVLANAGDTKKVEFEVEMMKRVKYSLNIKEQLNAQAGVASVQWTLDQSDVLKSNVGGWTLKALSPTSTEVEYKLDIEFGFSVPGFILKGLIANQLPNGIREVTERAKKLK